MSFSNHSTNCTKITVFVASFNACMNLIHISLLEGNAPLVLITDWMRKLKTSCFCFGNRLKTALCLSLQWFAQRQECNFFSVIACLQLRWSSTVRSSRFDALTFGFSGIFFRFLRDKISLGFSWDVFLGINFRNIIPGISFSSGIHFETIFYAYLWHHGNFHPLFQANIRIFLTLFPLSNQKQSNFIPEKL